MTEFDSKPYCDKFIKFAERFRKNFTYKKEDIVGLEEIFELMHEDYENKNMSDELAGQVAVYAGIFLGQLMLENKLADLGYRWELDGSEPCLSKDDGNKMYPITKALKQIENGCEDSVKSFYEVGIAIAERGMPT